MRQLMISLDKNILEISSASARRMIAYGENTELFIIIPVSGPKEKKNLSDRVHVYATGGGKIARFFRLLNLGRVLIKNNSINVITAQDPFVVGLVGVWLKNICRVPLEIQLHGDFYGDDYYKRSGIKNFLYYHLGKLYVLPRADKIRVAGERVRQSLVKMGVNGAKIIVRPIMVDTDYIKNYEPRFHLHERYSGYAKIFLSIGRLAAEKNVGWLITVFAEVIKKRPEFLLLIVGDGPENDSLRRTVSHLSLSNNVKFERWTADPLSYIKTADGVLFPSLSEGYGLVAMETAAAGTPLIMSDVGVANFELPVGAKVRVVDIKDRTFWVKLVADFVSV